MRYFLQMLWYEHKWKIFAVLLLSILLVIALVVTLTNRESIQEEPPQVNGVPTVILENMKENQQQGGFYIAGYMLDSVVTQVDEIGYTQLYTMYHILAPEYLPLLDMQAEYDEYLTYEQTDVAFLIHEEEQWKPIVYKVRYTNDGTMKVTMY